MEIRNLTRKKVNKFSPTERDARLKKYRKEWEKPCKGMFEFIDAQGGWIDFNLRIFPGESPMAIHLTHGEICEIPMGIVKHLNNTKKKVRTFGSNSGALRGNELPERGLPSSFETISRIRFTPLDVL